MLNNNLKNKVRNKIKQLITFETLDILAWYTSIIKEKSRVVFQKLGIKVGDFTIIKDSDILYTKVQNNGSQVPCFQRLDSIVQMFKAPCCYNVYLSPDFCSFILGFFEWNTTQVYKGAGLLYYRNPHYRPPPHYCNMALPLQEWHLIPPEADIFWGMAAELGFVHIDVEPIKSSNMIEALNDRKTYGFIVCKPNSDRSIGDISERERQESSNVTILMEEHDNMSPTTALLSILLNSNADIDGDSADRFNFFRERQPEVRIIPLPEDQIFNNVQNSFGSPGATAYHYVAFIFHNNSVWEINGRRKTCRRLVYCYENSWINAIAGLFDAPEYLSSPNMTYLAVTRDYSVDIAKAQVLVYDMLNGRETNALVLNQRGGLLENQALTEWSIALEDDSFELTIYGYDRIMALEQYKFYIVLIIHHNQARVEGNVLGNEVNLEYRSIQRPKLRSLYGSILYIGGNTSDSFSEESSTDQN